MISCSIGVGISMLTQIEYDTLKMQQLFYKELLHEIRQLTAQFNEVKLVVNKLLLEQSITDDRKVGHNNGKY